MIYPIQEETLQAIADAIKRLTGDYDSTIMVKDFVNHIKEYAVKYNTEVVINRDKRIRAPFTVVYTDFNTSSTVQKTNVTSAHFNAVQGSTINIYSSEGALLLTRTVPTTTADSFLILEVNAPWPDTEPMPGYGQII